MVMPDMLYGCISSINSNCRGAQVCTNLRHTTRSIEFCSFLFRRGWISGYSILNNTVIELHYKFYNNRNAMYRIQIISTPGNRVYYSYKKLSHFCSGPRRNAIFVLATSKGFLSSAEALSKHLGGELIARIIE